MAVASTTDEGRLLEDIISSLMMHPSDGLFNDSQVEAVGTEQGELHGNMAVDLTVL
jgi:hypothetical protein